MCGPSRTSPGLARVLTAVALLLTPAACTDEPHVATTNTRLEIVVSPLALDGVTDARWTVTVSSSSGSVWQRTLSASQYGAGGGLSYVGPCDASAGENTVTLVLEALLTSEGELVAGVDYANPAPADDPLERRVTCQPNADVAVSFDVTVARAAKQGFFDVAVSFEDIFCSAKLDCRDDAGDPLELLHRPNGGPRDTTVVLAFACTGGPEIETELCLDPIIVHCDNGGPFILEPSSGVGNVAIEPGSLFYAASVYRGTEQLSDAVGRWLGKAYWNVALGLDATRFGELGACTLTAAGTASSSPLADASTPDDQRWPVVTWEVPLTDGDAGLAGLACDRHPLDVANSGVKTVYSDPRTFGACYRSACANGIKDGDETDVDCGGGCPACSDGEVCIEPEDCLSMECPDGFCAVPSCDDGIHNGDELGVDCGGTCPTSCTSGDNLYDILAAQPALPAGNYTFVVHGAPIEVEYLVFGTTTVSTATTLGDTTPDQRMVIARYDGDLTVTAGGSLTTATRKKGLVLWVRGELQVDGRIHMNTRGAKAAGQDVWLYQADGGEPVVIPRNGAAGGTAVRSSGPNADGANGASGQGLGAPGGGGSGATHCNTCVAYSGAGARATSWSGGAGGGGVSRYYSNGNATAGQPNGGAGGAGSAHHPGGGYGKAAGGGAGVPGGAGKASGLGSGQAGGSGAGGLLVLFVEDAFTLSGSLEALGAAGGSASTGPTQWNAGGGGSGGGAIYGFVGGAVDVASGTASVAGGAGGQGYCHDAQCLRGGAGGTGFVSIIPFVPCSDCGRCDVPADCVSEVCNLGFCVEASCSDGVKNGDETCVDAGGSCPNRCPVGDTFYDALASDPTLPDGNWNLVAGSTTLPIESRAYGPTTISTSTSLGSATADARSLVVRYDGDLTITSTGVLTAAARKRGMFLWVRGDLVVDGQISMTARGATAAGANVPLAYDGAGTLRTIPATGGGGGAARVLSSGAAHGNVGSAPSNLGTGGGGGGGAHANSCTVTSGTGRPGTSWSGGTGGGGVSRAASNGTAGSGGPSGGAGGNGSAYQAGTTYGKSGGGGAGNGGGVAARSGDGICNASNGSVGTGGLLVIYVEGDVTLNGSLLSRGSAGGGTTVHADCWGAGGGGSGGGSVNLFYRGTKTGPGVLSASGGGGGSGYCGSSANSYCMNGGAGGAGSTLATTLE